jgi:hypothetical protein
MGERGILKLLGVLAFSEARLVILEIKVHSRRGKPVRKRGIRSPVKRRSKLIN